MRALLSTIALSLVLPSALVSAQKLPGQQPDSYASGYFIEPNYKQTTYTEGTVIDVSWNSTTLTNVNVYLITGFDFVNSQVLARNIRSSGFTWTVGLTNSLTPNNASQIYNLRTADNLGTDTEQKNGGFLSSSFYIKAAAVARTSTLSTSVLSSSSISSSSSSSRSATSLAAPSTIASSSSASARSSSSSAAAPSPTQSSSSSTLSSGASAGIGVGAGLGAIALAGLVWFALARRRKTKKNNAAAALEQQQQQQQMGYGPGGGYGGPHQSWGPGQYQGVQEMPNEPRLEAVGDSYYKPAVTAQPPQELPGHAVGR